MNASRNANMNKAKSIKNDEFYTLLPDIENELKHYRNHFKDKVVFCNCDDPKMSNFWKYFQNNFDFLGIKKLIATHYAPSDLFENRTAYKIEIVRGKDLNNDAKHDGHNIIETSLTENGDFRSQECIDILKQCDIICTNPPFSLFREYIDLLIEYKKQFLIIGNLNSAIGKEIFPLIQQNKIWLGVSSTGMKFKTPVDGLKHMGFACWFTNLLHKKRNEKVILYKEYTPKEYPKYLNYDAIEVNKVKDIPVDYEGYMGVPVSFLDKYNPQQFKIIGLSEIPCSVESYEHMLTLNGKSIKVGGKSRGFLESKTGKYKCNKTYRLYDKKYGRVFIKHKHPQIDT